MDFNMRKIGHCIAHMQCTGGYGVQHVDTYSIKFLKYLSQTYIFKDF
jgi:hypothetical protein